LVGALVVHGLLGETAGLALKAIGVLDSCGCLPSRRWWQLLASIAGVLCFSTLRWASADGNKGAA